MKMLTFAKRNATEILRDPLNLAFGLGFPIVILLLLSAIQASIPVSLFEIQHLSPGVTVFGASFLTLFSALIIAKDRKSAFLQRLYTTPLKASDFILGYMLPMIPIAITQAVVCYAVAMFLGLDFTVNIFLAVLFMIPVSLVFIGLGLLCGSVFNDKQVGGICGALLTNLSAWLSGIWFDLELVGGVFKRMAAMLPFYHAVELERALMEGSFELVFPHLLWVLAYDIIIVAAAVVFFLRQMKKQ